MPNGDLICSLGTKKKKKTISSISKVIQSISIQKIDWCLDLMIKRTVIKSVHHILKLYKKKNFKKANYNLLTCGLVKI